MPRRPRMCGRLATRSRTGSRRRTSSACCGRWRRRLAAPGSLPPLPRSCWRWGSTSTAKASSMPFMRRRPLLRAAAVGGGAYMYGKHRAGVQEEQQNEAYAAGQQSMVGAAPPPAAAPARAAGITAEDTARLQELGKLHEQGILTDDEFTQQKARILGIAPRARPVR